MGENEQGGMLRTVVVIGLVALIAGVIITGVVVSKANMNKHVMATTSLVEKQANATSATNKNLILGTETDTTWTVDSTDVYSFRIIAWDLKPNQTYTFSAEVTLSNTDQKITTIALYNAPKGQWQWLDSTDNFKADGTRDHWTFTVPSSIDNPRPVLIAYAGRWGHTEGESVIYHHIKLETGNTPTDWTPAPED